MRLCGDLSEKTKQQSIYSLTAPLSVKSEDLNLAITCGRPDDDLSSGRMHNGPNDILELAGCGSPLSFSHIKV